MAPLEMLIVAIGSLAAFASVMALGLHLLSHDQLAGRLKAVAARRRELSARERERLAGGGRFQPRRHVGLMKAVIARLNLQQMLEAKDLRLKLARAGCRGNNAAVTFIFSRVALPVVLMALALLYTASPGLADSLSTRLMVALSAFIAGSYLPSVWLANMAQRRQQALTRAFPEALDLMLISVEAGQSVEGALLRVTEELGASSPALAEEIGLTAAELAFLGDRRQAWDNLAERTGVPQFKSLATVLMQSEKYGTAIGQALRVLAQETRDSRMAAAEKKAAALPAKLTVPMISFFLPVLFLVICGPAAIQIIQYRAGG